MHDIDLKNLERRAFRSTFQDGLWDLYLGLLLLLFGIGLSLLEFEIPIEWIVVIAITLCLLFIGSFFAGKKFVTIPRIGRVIFSPARQLKTKKTTLLLVMSFLVGAALLIARLVGNGDLFGWMAPIPLPAFVFSTMCLIIFSCGAYLLDYERLYLYGILYALPFPVAVILKTHTEMIGVWLLVYGIPSVIMLIIGAVLFLGFLRAYPLPATEVSDARE